MTLAAPKVDDGSPKVGVRVKLEGLQYRLEVSWSDGAVTAPDLTIGPGVKALAVRVPGKSGGITGGWRDEVEEGGAYRLKCPSKAERGVRGVTYLLVDIH